MDVKEDEREAVVHLKHKRKRRGSEADAALEPQTERKARRKRQQPASSDHDAKRPVAREGQFLRETTRTSSANVVASSDGVAQQRSSSQSGSGKAEDYSEYLSSLSFDDVKQLKHVHVVHCEPNFSTKVWRVDECTPNEDTKTFTVVLHEIPVTLHNVPPNRLRKPSALVPAV